jgi:hypothetical protein
VRIVLKACCEDPDEPRGQRIVGIDIGQQIAGGDCDAVVVAQAGVAEVYALVADAEGGVLRRDRRGVIGAGVIHDDDLVRRAILRQDTLQAFAQIAPVVVTGHDDAHPRAHASPALRNRTIGLHGRPVRIVPAPSPAA